MSPGAPRQDIPAGGAPDGNSPWPLVVVGAGAAGMMAALWAARAGIRVLLLETRPRPGAKIRVSGGGRCNLLPSEMHLDDFSTSGSMHALRNVLFSWPLAEVRAFFERDLGVALKTEPTGKIFPVSERPQDVVDALLRARARAGVTLAAGRRIADVRVLAAESSAPARFEIIDSGGECMRSTRLVLATGGLSLPKTGSDGAGIDIARRLGLEIVPTYPALVPLTTSAAEWRALAGVAVRAEVSAVRGERVLETRERELLITHRGWSGPVVLDMSRHVTAPGSGDVRLLVRWGGSAAPDWDAMLRLSGKRRVATVLGEHLPARLAVHLLATASVPVERWLGELRRDERQRLVEILTRYPLPVAGSEGYATAEVTGGGVSLAALHTRTLESRVVPGLHLAGEMLDVVGRIGGHNFLWAWTSGRRAGVAAAAALRDGPASS